jgi:hypothetical protein
MWENRFLTAFPKPMAAFFIGNFSFHTNSNIVRVLKKVLFIKIQKFYKKGNRRKRGNRRKSVETGRKLVHRLY